MFRLEHNRRILSKEQWRACATGIWLVALLALFPLNSYTQNLVPNPSFELIDTCPSLPTVLGYQVGAKPMYWERFSSTPDYLTGCAPNGQINGVPNNIFTYQNAWDGQTYSGAWSFASMDIREFFGVELTTTLTIGETYYGSFYINTALGGSQLPGLACNNLGMWLTTFSFYWDFDNGVPADYDLPNFAHVYTDQIVSDTANWTLVSGSFIADSAYQYLVLGNFFDNDHTQRIYLDSSGGWSAYYLFDEICLSLDPQGCPLPNGVNEVSNHGVKLYPNPAHDFLIVDWGSIPVETVWVYDMLGKEILMKSILLSEKKLRIDLNSLCAGQYVLRVLGKEFSLCDMFFVSE